jgi:hypothetical protein
VIQASAPPRIALGGRISGLRRILSNYQRYLVWDIELAFKRLKSLIKIDEIRTRTEAGTRCWLYANLIVALLADDCSQDLLESFPSGTR